MNISRTNQNKIHLTEFISRNLFLRNSANELFDWIENLKTSEIVVDFSKIQSITRAFADQYIRNMEKSKKNIINANIPTHIRNMFDMIEKTKLKSKEVTVY